MLMTNGSSSNSTAIPVDAAISLHKISEEVAYLLYLCRGTADAWINACFCVPAINRHLSGICIFVCTVVCAFARLNATVWLSSPIQLT